MISIHNPPPSVEEGKPSEADTTDRYHSSILVITVRCYHIVLLEWADDCWQAIHASNPSLNTAQNHVTIAIGSTR